MTISTSRIPSTVLALTAMFGLMLLTASVAHATRYYDSTIGTQSASATGTPPTPAGTAYGATFSSASGGVGDIAVNDPTVSTDGSSHAGWIYVVDRGNNRIQAFDANRNFQWAIGRDVIASTVNEHQNLTATATAGQFKLEFNGQTTVDLAWNATTAAVQTALRNLSTITGTNVNVTGTPATATVPGVYVISFVGTLASADQPQITVQAGTTPLTGTASVATIANGTNSVPGNLGDVFEKCTVAVHCKAGSIGTATDGPGGELNVATGIDIDQSTGRLYVGERNANARVQQFGADGDFIRAFGWDVVASGPGDTGGFETCNVAAGDVCKAGITAQNFGTGNPGQFGSSTEQTSKGVAVAPPGAPNAGQLYVADPGSCRVQRFTVPSSASSVVVPGAPFGLPSSSGGPLGDDAFCTRALNGTVTANSPRDVAADGNGVVYASTLDGSQGGMVKRFDTAATITGTFRPTIFVGGGPNVLGDAGGPVTALEIDQASGHLLLTRGTSVATLGIAEIDVTDNPDQVDAGDVVDRHLVGLGANPLALGSGGGRFYLSTSNNVIGTGTGHRVLVLDDDGVEPDPIITVQPPTNVGSRSATLSGTVNPVVTTIFPTSYRWQISKDGVTWVDKTADALVGGTGFVTESVSSNVGDLEPNTLYRVRIRASRAPAAGIAFSPEMTLQTDPEPPTVQTRPAQHVSDASARLVATLNPGGLPTTYWFEWGDDDYGNQAPIEPAATTGAVDRLVAETLTGLAPERVYHYRICAQNVLSVKTCGADATFTTRAAAALPAGRSYEMATTPDKESRRGGAFTTPGFDFSRLQSGLPAVDGSRFAASYFAQPADGDANYGSAVFDMLFEIRHRGVNEWDGEAVFNVAPAKPTSISPLTSTGSWSADLASSGWATGDVALVGDSFLATRMLDDSGGPVGAGWYPWLDLSWASAGDMQTSYWKAQLDDAGSRVLAQSEAPLSNRFRDVIPADGGTAPSQLTPPQVSGRAVFLGYKKHGWRPFELVNECTGSGGSATTVPSRDDGGTLSGPAGSFNLPGFSTGSGSTAVTQFNAGTTQDVRVGHYVFGSTIPPGARVVSINSDTQFTISAPASGFALGVTGGREESALTDDKLSIRECTQGSPTDVRGASYATSSRLAGAAEVTTSDDGSRVFFLSPDPTVPEGGDACETGDSAVGVGTTCPPQLFVRQFDDDGNATVRWLSRPEDALLEDGGGNPQMTPAALGSGVAFEGASKDGSVVYFRTDAPLTTDDPNGGLDPLEQASPESWDLYRYELGPNSNLDPGAGDSGDRLTRITAGPSGSADPNTNCAAVPTAGPDTGDVCVGGLEASTQPNAGESNGTANGAGAAVRFISGNGDRAYFVTAAAIPGADNAPPGGGKTVATAADQQINAATRNLYLHDSTKSGSAAYKFIARLPFTTADRIDACASSEDGARGPQAFTARTTLRNSGGNCVHGSSSGDAIVFTTTAQLTSDDTDAVGDVYVYDADSDELVRLTAPGPGDQAYACTHVLPAGVGERCNGDLGFASANAHLSTEGPGLAGERHWNVAQDSQGAMTDIYFETRLPLVDGDQNANVNDVLGGMDVYRWRRADGDLSLVSTGGDGDLPAFYAGNSRDGSDVFFWTERRISSWEQDEADADIYNATTRPAFPDPPPPPPVCDVLALQCQGGGAPKVDSDTTTTTPAPDDGTATPRRKLSLAGLSAQARRRAARTGVIPIKVGSDAAGRIDVTARSRLAGRSVRVARGSVRMRTAGTRRLSLRLSAKARSVLRQGKPLKVVVKITSTGVRPRSMSVLLRRSK